MELYLVLYEGQQRANNQGAATAEQSWQLVAEAFATAGRHEAQHVSALHGGVDHLPLLWPEKNAM